MILLSCIAILTIDYLTPHGVSEWIMYIFVLLCSFNSAYKKFPFYVTLITTAFVFIGYLLSSGGIPPGWALLNRFLGIVVIWLIVKISYDRQMFEEKLEESIRILNFHNEHTPLAAIEFNDKYQIVKWSGNAERMFGWKAEEVLGKAVGEFQWVYEEDLEIVTGISSEMFNNSNTSNVITNRNYCKDGSVITCEWYNSAFVDSSGKMISVYSLVHNISDRKQAELQLKKYSEKLKEMNRTKDKFFSIIAHDLRSPFQGLLGYSQILREEYNSLSEDEKIHIINSIQELSGNTFRLLDNLLQWSRLQTKKIVFKPEEFNLLEELYPTITALEYLAKNKGINLNYVIDGSISLVADKNMLNLIVRNLISNSVKFTEPGGEINLSVEKYDDYVQVSIKDTGVGIEENKFNDLFNIGQNISTKGTAGEGGSGLGLVLCKEMVEKHNGKIWVESEIGKGSRFCFTMQVDGNFISDNHDGME